MDTTPQSDCGRTTSPPCGPGRRGFLLKDAPTADLVATIRIVAAGDAVVAPAVTRRLLEQFARLPDPGTSTVGTDA